VLAHVSTDRTTWLAFGRPAPTRSNSNSNVFPPTCPASRPLASSPRPRPSRHPYFPPSLSIDQSQFLKKSSRPARRTPLASPHGRRLADRPPPPADVKPRKTVVPARVPRCPSPTVPRSGLLRFWEGFLGVYRIARFYCVRFLPYFDLDSLLSIPHLAPLDLDFTFDIRRDVTHPRRAPCDDSVNFLTFGHRFSSHTTPRSLSPAVSLSRLSLSIPPSGSTLCIDYLCRTVSALHINTPASNLVKG